MNTDLDQLRRQAATEASPLLKRQYEKQLREIEAGLAKADGQIPDPNGAAKKPARVKLSAIPAKGDKVYRSGDLTDEIVYEIHGVTGSSVHIKRPDGTGGVTVPVTDLYDARTAKAAGGSMRKGPNSEGEPDIAMEISDDATVVQELADGYDEWADDVDLERITKQEDMAFASLESAAEKLVEVVKRIRAGGPENYRKTVTGKAARPGLRKASGQYTENYQENDDEYSVAQLADKVIDKWDSGLSLKGIAEELGNASMDVPELDPDDGDESGDMSRLVGAFIAEEFARDMDEVFGRLKSAKAAGAKTLNKARAQRGIAPLPGRRPIRKVALRGAKPNPKAADLRKVVLKDFDQTDWDAFAGAEEAPGAPPKIGDCKVKFNGGDSSEGPGQMDGVVIADTTGVAIIATDEEDDYAMYEWRKASENYEANIRTAKTLPKVVDHEMLVALGFEQTQGNPEDDDLEAGPYRDYDGDMAHLNGKPGTQGQKAARPVMRKADRGQLYKVVFKDGKPGKEDINLTLKQMFGPNFDIVVSTGRDYVIVNAHKTPLLDDESVDAWKVSDKEKAAGAAMQKRGRNGFVNLSQLRAGQKYTIQSRRRPLGNPDVDWNVQFLGWTDNTSKYSETPRYNSLRDLMAAKGARTIPDLEAMEGKPEYGYSFYACFMDLDDEQMKWQAYFYNGRLAYGSSADPMAFRPYDDDDQGDNSRGNIDHAPYVERSELAEAARPAGMRKAKHRIGKRAFAELLGQAKEIVSDIKGVNSTYEPVTELEDFLQEWDNGYDDESVTDRPGWMSEAQVDQLAEVFGANVSAARKAVAGFQKPDDDEYEG